MRMKLLPSLSLFLLAALIAYAAYVADNLFGIVAFADGYLIFCAVAAFAFGGAWRALTGTSGLVFGLLVFGILAVNFVLPPPSERLLRSVMLKAPAGTDASTIVDIVKQEYKDGPYAMPWIHEDRAGGFDRIHVSLLPQQAKSCTSAIFLVQNGRVSRSIFSPD